MNNLPSILWFIFALATIFTFRKGITGLLTILIWRVKTGSPLKIGDFELGAGQYYISSGQDAQTNQLFQVRNDDNNNREQEREKYYEPNRRIFLVHRISPSKKPNQLYDIFIYLVPHKKATLANVQSVDYYFGPYWKNHIFTTIDRANGFPISTSAFGPFVCTAKLNFTDGESCIVMRYIDFEMGTLGKEPISM